MTKPKFNQQMINLLKENCDDQTWDYIEFLEREVRVLCKMNYDNLMITLELLKQISDGSASEAELAADLMKQGGWDVYE